MQDAEYKRAPQAVRCNNSQTGFLSLQLHYLFIMNTFEEGRGIGFSLAVVFGMHAHTE